MAAVPPPSMTRVLSADSDRVRVPVPLAASEEPMARAAAPAFVSSISRMSVF